MGSVHIRCAPQGLCNNHACNYLFVSFHEQLFGSPHPQKRLNAPPIPRPLRKCFSQSETIQQPHLNVSTLLQPRADVECPLQVLKNVSGIVRPVSVEEALVANSCVSVIPGPPTSAVIAIKITGKKMICVRDNGVVDVYRYGCSESVKAALNLYAKLHPSGPAARRGSVLRSGQIPVAHATTAVSTDTAAPSIATLMRRESLTETSLNPDIISFDAFDSGEISGAHHSFHRDDTESQANQDFASVLDVKSSSFSAPFLQWTTKDHIVITAESIISDSVSVPRIPVTHIRPGGTISDRNGSFGINMPFDSHFVHFLRLDSLVLMAGRSDGMICVRELDINSGEQLTGGDFRGHRFQVTHLASDSIINGNSSLVASCDIAGQILVWTVSVSSHQGFNRHIVSRRPQRVFRCFPGINCCDISWQMGVVLVGSKHCISIFSIERNERFRLIDVRVDALSSFFINEPSTSIPKNLNSILSGLSSKFSPSDMNSTNGVSNANRFNENRLWGYDFGCNIFNIVCSDYGSIVCYAEFDTSKMPEISLSKKILVVMAYSMNGSCTGYLLLQSRLTCLDCPGRGSIISIGTDDGTVIFANSLSLDVLHRFKPNENCVRLNSAGEVLTNRPDSRHSNKREFNGQSHGDGDLSTSISPSAIVIIKVGPKLDRPIFAAISNLSGQIYLMPFLDFIKFEKMNATTAFAQIVNAPIQAVKGTIQSAQNFTMLAGDAAGSLAHNARGLAGEAIGEAQDFIKKVVIVFLSDERFVFTFLPNIQMNKSKLFKGVGSFFGGGSSGPEK